MDVSTSPATGAALGGAVPNLVPSTWAYRLSACLAVVTIAATVPTFLVEGILHGPPVMTGSGRGTALMMCLAGVPVLLTAQVLTRRGVTAALPVWLGAVAFLTYNGFMLLFGTPFNSLFLLYVALFSLALWSIVAILRVVDVAALGRRIRPGAPYRAIAVFVWVVVTLNAAAWLRGIVPGLADSASPKFLEGTGLTTLPTYVQDLAVWLPLMATAAYWLWRGLAWGHLVVAALLVQLVLEGLTVAVDQYVGSSADPLSSVASASMTPAFLVVAVVTFVPALLLVRRM